jgi:hypothetical protein
VIRLLVLIGTHRDRLEEVRSETLDFHYQFARRMWPLAILYRTVDRVDTPFGVLVVVLVTTLEDAFALGGAELTPHDVVVINDPDDPTVIEYVMARIRLEP